MLRKIYVVALMLLLSACASIPDANIRMKSNVLTTGGDTPRVTRTPQSKFNLGDRIFSITVVEWDDIEKPAGRKNIKWRWYSSNKLVTLVERDFIFHATPFELYGTISAQALGAGEGKVEVYLNDKLLSVQQFTVE